MAISNRYLVRRGAVLGSDRPGEVRNSDTFVGKPRPDLWIIDQACCKPGVHAAALAARHGRLQVLNAEAAKESTGHGAPLPMLKHGGPGRAGGGEPQDDDTPQQ